MLDPLSRRAFAERLALAVAAPFILEDLPPLTGSSAPNPAAEGAQAQEPSALARALAEAVRLRYPDRLTPEELDTVTRNIDSRLRGLERLYQVPLRNSDEPDFVFSVYRGEDR
ncbi:MAG TPA: hypothetical protein VNI61_04815 [Gemmatimonadales bacterium]|nr:hypothetical protein [Gemmatimonadales bacterium]